jgi:hypothetical protein
MTNKNLSMLLTQQLEILKITLICCVVTRETHCFYSMLEQLAL